MGCLWPCAAAAIATTTAAAMGSGPGRRGWWLFRSKVRCPVEVVRHSRDLLSYVLQDREAHSNNRDPKREQKVVWHFIGCSYVSLFCSIKFSPKQVLEGAEMLPFSMNILVCDVGFIALLSSRYSVQCNSIFPLCMCLFAWARLSKRHIFMRFFMTMEKLQLFLVILLFHLLTETPSTLRLNI